MSLKLPLGIFCAVFFILPKFVEGKTVEGNTIVDSFASITFPGEIQVVDTTALRLAVLETDSGTFQFQRIDLALMGRKQFPIDSVGLKHFYRDYAAQLGQSFGKEKVECSFDFNSGGAMWSHFQFETAVQDSSETYLVKNFLLKTVLYSVIYSKKATTELSKEGQQFLDSFEVKETLTLLDQVIQPGKASSGQWSMFVKYILPAVVVVGAYSFLRNRRRNRQA